jgi:membrane protein DedA with SNARE-associated domain
VTLIFSGVAVHQGWMSFPLAVLAATGGNLVGSLIAYALGASGVLNGVPVAGAILRRGRH